MVRKGKGLSTLSRGLTLCISSFEGSLSRIIQGFSDYSQRVLASRVDRSVLGPKDVVGSSGPPGPPQQSLKWYLLNSCAVFLPGDWISDQLQAYCCRSFRSRGLWVLAQVHCQKSTKSSHLNKT